jgi:hypothetical protein
MLIGQATALEKCRDASRRPPGRNSRRFELSRIGSPCTRATLSTIHSPAYFHGALGNDRRGHCIPSSLLAALMERIVGDFIPASQDVYAAQNRFLVEL